MKDKPIDSQASSSPPQNPKNGICGSASCSTLTLTEEEAWLLSEALSHAKTDIWQTLRVTETNLSGKDPTHPDLPPIKREKPVIIHRAGADESYRVHDEVGDALQMLARKMKGWENPKFQ